MFNSNDILARLQNGENPEAIANEMADCLNHAIDMHQAAELEETLDCAADDINTYLRAKYPQECAMMDLDLDGDGEDLGELLDVLMSILPMIAKIGDVVPTLPRVAPTCNCHVSKDPIQAFLSEMGLLQ